MSALALKQVSKSFPGTRALDRVDLLVDAGEIHALIGQNGSGKSTLVKLLSGNETPDPGGKIEVDGTPLPCGSPHASWVAGCRFVHQDLGLVDAMSVEDNLSLTAGWPTRWGTIRRSSARAQARAALEPLGLDVDPAALVGELSAAARTGVAVARALRPDTRAPISLLVLDEPTATLPEADVRQLSSVVRAVAARGVAVLFVTHHLEEVLELADVVTVLRDGRRVLTVPTVGLTRPDLVSAMVGHELERTAANLPQGPGGTSSPLLEVRDLAAGRLAGVDLAVRAGEVVGVAGLDGSGREDLLPAIFGARERERGQVTVRGRPLAGGDPRQAMSAGAALVPGDRQRRAAIGELSARENLTLADLAPVTGRAGVRRAAERTEVARWFARLDIRPAQASEAPLHSFSGGNQQKIMLARWLRRDPALLLLDEPTQGVDVGAQARLHAEVLDAARDGAGVLVSSSDNEELAALCHRVLVLAAGHVTTELAGAELTPHAISHAMLGAAA